MQEMSMDYHFKVEQEAGSSLFNFFGYNGGLLINPCFQTAWFQMFLEIKMSFIHA
jgi:hypothetical protein